ncbi:hypothetical protein [Brevibacillus sp. Leaf182]|uniref:hypothetical protein n=1 Tax=Brevibacillus sp. Leaf182 TaxID=1736290 RepID=UPI000AB4E73A|nr:hypothetical protein [Brevibacillus sp. Leaf182]
MGEAEIPRHFFLRWGGLQRRLDWKCTSSYAAFVKKVMLEAILRRIELTSKNGVKPGRKRKLYGSPVTCLEGDRPNEVRIQATGKHVTGLHPDHNRPGTAFLFRNYFDW